MANNTWNKDYTATSSSYQNRPPPITAWEPSDGLAEYSGTAEGDNPKQHHPAQYRHEAEAAPDLICGRFNRNLGISKIFYFFFFSAFGSLYPLMSIYFKQMGMNPSQSGVLTGFRPFVEFCSAPLWSGIADKWRKGKLILLFSVLCWIAFSVAIGFVHPPAHSCLMHNETSKTSYLMKPRDRRDVPVNEEIFDNRHPDRSDTLGKSPIQIDPDKIMNWEQMDGKTLIKPVFTSIVYDEVDVQGVFLVLLLLIIIGEFFSAPAITLADSCTLYHLGENIDLYGRQRMFGSLGWGLCMFFVSVALDRSHYFINHPCGQGGPQEKNYTFCFVVFTVFMSCALAIATRFRFFYGGEEEIVAIADMKDSLKHKINQMRGKEAHHAYDKERLIEDDSQDDLSNLDGQNGHGMKISLNDNKTAVSDTLGSGGRQPSGEGSQERRSLLPQYIAVLKVCASIKYGSFLFIVWWTGFGIGLVFTFLFWHLQDLGGSSTLFGVASVINHVSELIAYFYIHQLISRFGHIKLLYAGLFGNMVRFLYVSWLRSPWWVLPFELVQGITHAAVWASSCSYFIQAVPFEARASAQGILQGVHHGLGKGCGAVIGGLLAHRFGTDITFRIYGLGCLVFLGIFILLNYISREKGKPSLEDPEPAEFYREGTWLLPHGVPSNPMARAASSSKLDQHAMGTVKPSGSAYPPLGNQLAPSMPPTTAPTSSNPFNSTGPTGQPNFKQY